MHSGGGGGGCGAPYYILRLAQIDRRRWAKRPVSALTSKCAERKDKVVAKLAFKAEKILREARRNRPARKWSCALAM